MPVQSEIELLSRNAQMNEHDSTLFLHTCRSFIPCICVLVFLLKTYVLSSVFLVDLDKNWISDPFQYTKIRLSTPPVPTYSLPMTITKFASLCQHLIPNYFVNASLIFQYFGPPQIRNLVDSRETLHKSNAVQTNGMGSAYSSSYPSDWCLLAR